MKLVKIEDPGSLLDVNAIKWTQKEILGQYALEVEFENVAGGYTGKLSWTYIPKGDKVYRIAAFSNYGDMTQSEFQNKLISTFKFIE